MWEEAARDIDAEREALQHAQAKVAVADFWPFLVQAGDEREFAHRMALVSDQMDERISRATPDPRIRQAVLESVREDFRTVLGSRPKPRPRRPRQQERVKNASRKTAEVKTFTAKELSPGDAILWHEQRRIVKSVEPVPGGYTVHTDKGPIGPQKPEATYLVDLGRDPYFASRRKQATGVAPALPLLRGFTYDGVSYSRHGYLDGGSSEEYWTNDGEWKQITEDEYNRALTKAQADPGNDPYGQPFRPHGSRRKTAQNIADLHSQLVAEGYSVQVQGSALVVSLGGRTVVVRKANENDYAVTREDGSVAWYTSDTVARGIEMQFVDQSSDYELMDHHLQGSRKTAAWADAAREVVRSNQHQTVEGVLLDLFSASALVGLLDGLSEENRQRLEAMPLVRAHDVAMKVLSRTASREIERHTAGDLAPCVVCGTPTTSDVLGQVGDTVGPMCEDCQVWSDGNIITAASYPLGGPMLPWDAGLFNGGPTPYDADGGLPLDPDEELQEAWADELVVPPEPAAIDTQASRKTAEADFQPGDFVVEKEYSGVYPKGTKFYVEEVFEGSFGETTLGVRPDTKYSGMWETFYAFEMEKVSALGSVAKTAATDVGGSLEEAKEKAGAVTTASLHDTLGAKSDTELISILDGMDVLRAEGSWTEEHRPTENAAVDVLAARHDLDGHLDDLVLAGSHTASLGTPATMFRQAFRAKTGKTLPKTVIRVRNHLGKGA